MALKAAAGDMFAGAGVTLRRDGGMQLDAIGKAFAPAKRADGVENRTELAAGFGKSLLLSRRGLQLEADGASHGASIHDVVWNHKTLGSPGASPARLKPAVPAPWQSYTSISGAPFNGAS